MVLILVGLVNNIPTMRYFEILSHTPSIIAYNILTEFLWNSSQNPYCGDVVNMSHKNCVTCGKLANCYLAAILRS